MGRCVYTCVAVALSAMACLEPALPPPSASAPDAGPVGCSPMTCTGCCHGDRCLGGNEQHACGYDGRACRECPGDTACVTPGACVSVPGDAGFNTPFNADGGVPVFIEPVHRPNHCYFYFFRLICF